MRLQLRVPDGPLACEGVHFTEAYWVGTLTAASPADWAACLEIPVDPETCEMPETHPGCEMERVWRTSEWTAEAVDEPMATPRGTWPAMRIRQVVREDGTADDMEIQWWARGVGKLREAHEPLEVESLVDYCLPADGCERPAPGWATLKALCE